MKNLTTYIQNNFKFSIEEIERITDCFTSKLIPKKEFFLKEGQYCKNVGFVESGSFIYYEMVDGEVKVCDFAFENDWVAQYKSLLSQQPSEVGIQAMEDAEVLNMDMHKMDALSEAMPKVSIIRSTLAEQYFTKSSQRATNLTNLDAKARYQALLDEIPHIHEKIPQYHIATYLGIKPQSLSRIRAEK